MYNAVTQLYICIYPLFLRFSSHIGHYRVLSRVPCATRVCMLSRSAVSNTSVTPQTVACQAPLSLGFSRQECWSGVPFPPPGDLPDPGIKPVSPTSAALAGGFFTTVLFSRSLLVIYFINSSVYCHSQSPNLSLPSLIPW